MRVRGRADQWLGEVCPHCGARAVFYEDGHWVCRKCGTVIEDHPLTHTGAGTSEGKEEPLRITPELARLRRHFQEAHRDALEWMGKPETNPPRGSGSTPIGPGYAKALARALTTSGIIQDTRRAELFAERLASQLEYKHKAYGVEVPSIDRVIRAIRCMLYGVPNTKDCEQPTSVVDAAKKAINITHYYGDLIRYIAKEKFGKNPNDELVQRAERYLRKLNDWIRSQGVSKGGISDYPTMPMVAAVALAIADAETGDPRGAIKALSKGGTRAIITRLRLNEFINQLTNRETKT
jgi:uncharacterized Zn finger protein (UPF0148 family)